MVEAALDALRVRAGVRGAKPFVVFLGTHGRTGVIRYIQFCSDDLGALILDAPAACAGGDAVAWLALVDRLQALRSCAVDPEEEILTVFAPEDVAHGMPSVRLRLPWTPENVMICVQEVERWFSQLDMPLCEMETEEDEEMC